MRIVAASSSQAAPVTAAPKDVLRSCTRRLTAIADRFGRPWRRPPAKPVTTMVRECTIDDLAAVFRLASALATSPVVEIEAFTVSFSAIVAADDAALLVAEEGREVIG